MKMVWGFWSTKRWLELPYLMHTISIRITARPHNMTIIQVFIHLHTVMQMWKCAKNNYMWSKKCLRYPLYDHGFLCKGGSRYLCAIHTGGIGETNDSGLQLLEFTQSNRLTQADTLHPQKSMSRLATQQVQIS